MAYTLHSNVRWTYVEHWTRTHTDQLQSTFKCKMYIWMYMKWNHKYCTANTTSECTLYIWAAQKFERAHIVLNLEPNTVV